MMQIHEDMDLDGLPVVRLESDHLVVDVVPEVGGRIVRIREKSTGHEFLWTNERLDLERVAPGSQYDPNFYGGIDELLPSDLPEPIGDFESPDHGELWTTPLEARIEGDRLVVSGRLPISGLEYERGMTLRADGPAVDLSYRIANRAASRRDFLWKLHAALRIAPGDVIQCPARRGQVVDLEWSRFHTLEPFDWPTIESQAANVIPEKTDTTDFFYLFDLESGEMAWRRPTAGLVFRYRFDTKVFPYAWLFASYGGLDGHYTAVLEPCTSMPLSVSEAAALGQCSSLEPGEVLETQVTLEAGPEH